MKYLRLCATLILFVTTAASARLAAQGAPPPTAVTPPATPVVPTQEPIIQLDNPIFDFVKASVGEKIRHTYVVSNTGNAALVIANVKPGCHCTTIGDWTHTIEPGQQGGITIQFDTSGMSGSISRTIDVTSNAKNEPRKVLLLKGTVWKPIEVTPATAVISIAPDTTNTVSTTVHLVNQTDNPVTISNPISANRLFTTVLKETKPGKEYDLIITAQPPFVPGNAPGTITVNTSLPGTPNVNVTVIANVTPAVQIYPSQIPLSAVVEHWVTNKVTIHGNTTNALTLSNPKASDSRIHVEVQSMGPKGMFSMLVEFPPGFQLEPGQRAEATVESSHPSFPVIKIPIVQFPHSKAAPYPFPPKISGVPTTNTAALTHQNPPPPVAHP